MRCAPKVLFTAAHLTAVLAATLLPVILFSRLLRAEGPLALLHIWTAVCSFCIFFAVRPVNGRGWKLLFRRGMMILAAIFGLVAILVVLAQVNVARRSLAEAWLELARQGRAFGFFSFFTSEIYAIFALAQALLLSARRYIAFVLCAAATNFLCAGIILDNAPFLFLCLLFSFLLFLIPPAGASRERYASRLLSVSVPALAGLLLAVLVSFIPAGNGRTPQMIRTPDFSELFVRLAPSFPLMRDVPGYGFSAGGADMPSSVYLSGRALFTVEGTPLSTHYLASVRYREWNGTIWKEDTDAGDLLPFALSAEAPANALKLTLVDDFYPGVPTELATAEAVLSPDAPANASFTRNKGIRFEPSARRGFQAYLISGKIPEGEAEGTAGLAAGEAGGGASSARIAALARELRERAGDSDREFIRLLLDHFSEGYRYSLQTARQKKKTDSIEYFLFEGKQGFCLYFASAFVLLAREGGLSSRLAEGFRVDLDERGQGTISGNNAHAWPEIWIDGEWRTFEPTPPYAGDDPFAYVNEDDEAARRQLEALFGSSDNATGKPFGAKNLLTAAIRILAAGSLAAAALYFLTRKKGKLRRKAARMVKYYRKRGVSGPEAIGWLAWAREAERREAGGTREGEAKAIAGEMIEIAYGAGE